MAFTTEQTVYIESSMADFLTKRRPPEEIRHKLDLGWRIEGQSVVVTTQVNRDSEFGFFNRRWTQIYADLKKRRDCWIAA